MRLFLYSILHVASAKDEEDPLPHGLTMSMDWFLVDIREKERCAVLFDMGLGERERASGGGNWVFLIKSCRYPHNRRFGFCKDRIR